MKKTKSGKFPIESTAIEDRKTGQYFPAIKYSDGSVQTYSPTSFEKVRALQIADNLIEDIRRRSK